MDVIQSRVHQRAWDRANQVATFCGPQAVLRRDKENLSGFCLQGREGTWFHVSAWVNTGQKRVGPRKGKGSSVFLCRPRVQSESEDMCCVWLKVEREVALGISNSVRLRFT